MGPARIFTTIMLLIFAAGCASLSGDKRGTLANEVAQTRDSLDITRTQFKSAFAKYKALLAAEGPLEAPYRSLHAEYQRTAKSAMKVRKQLLELEPAGIFYYNAWDEEINAVYGLGAREHVIRKKDASEEEFAALLLKLQKAEAAMNDAIAALREPVLALKGNRSENQLQAARNAAPDIERKINKMAAEVNRAVVDVQPFLQTLLK